jgi:hypothetical protein
MFVVANLRALFSALLFAFPPSADYREMFFAVLYLFSLSLSLLRHKEAITSLISETAAAQMRYD